MFLTDLSIKRPVVASVMSLVLVIFGLLTFQEIPTDELPDVQPPVVTIQTEYRGASAEIVDTQITQKIEDFVGGTPGLETISSRIDPSTRSILARIVVDNPNFEIIPGQLMTVKVIYDEINQIGVPESAVTIQGNTAFVYIVNANIAEKKNIKMGKRNFGKVSVVSGIDEGDMVISEGISKVRNKSKIKIINP